MATDLTKLLREAIADSGLSLKRIADESGLAYNAVWSFANGSRGLTVESASRLCEALGLDLRLGRRGKRKTGGA